MGIEMSYRLLELGTKLSEPLVEGFDVGLP